uniref:JmjC domain-containing protein n=1 Tax=Physcomitrium patens TaxID=3218 RepID=A0A7I4D4Y9_PHYPA
MAVAAAGELLDLLSREVRELSLGCTPEVVRIDGPPDPVQFLRDFVMPNRPCIITNAIAHWPALRLWSNSYLQSQLAHRSVSCHFTPDGRADALVQAPQSADVGSKSSHSDGGDLEGEGPANEIVFASSLVEVLPFPTALECVLSSSCEDRSVAYLQQQNNCFPLEFSALSEDVDSDIAWASEALGCKPEAVNLWIGTQESVTSFHKDHYENLYAVVSGEKHFTLLPPTDVHRMYVKKYPAAHYERTLLYFCRTVGAWCLNAIVQPPGCRGPV